MRYMFPYHLVDRDSRIVLYGCGECGKDFWLQIHYSQYCQLIAWIDKSFNMSNPNPPFARTNEITRFCFDYVVIAVTDSTIVEKIKNMLLSEGINEEMIIWSNSYSMGSDLFPTNKNRMLKDFDFYTQIMDESVMSGNMFAGNQYYQGFKELGIKGSRQNEERIVIYKIPQLLNRKMSAFDMGCNYGFFDLLVAPYVKEITGIDIEQAFIRMAQITADYLSINNATFVCDDAFKYLNANEIRYEVIFNLGVYGYILNSGVSEEQFVKVITSHLSINGLLFFESHPLSDENRINSYKSICEKIERVLSLESVSTYTSIGERELRIYRLK